MTDNERMIELLNENKRLSKRLGAIMIGVFKNEQEIREDNELMRKLIIEFQKEGLIFPGDKENDG